jgi:hypothetical protein
MHPAAEMELEKATAHYEAQREGLGLEFRLEFEAAVARLQENPLQFANNFKQMRICPLKRFAYSIHFADLEDRIWIAAVAHQHRRPRYWAKRKPENGSAR